LVCLAWKLKSTVMKTKHPDGTRIAWSWVNLFSDEFFNKKLFNFSFARQTFTIYISKYIHYWTS